MRPVCPQCRLEPECPPYKLLPEELLLETDDPLLPDVLFGSDELCAWAPITRSAAQNAVMLSSCFFINLPFLGCCLVGTRRKPAFLNNTKP